MENKPSQHFRSIITFVGPDHSRVQQLTICSPVTGIPMTQDEWEAAKIDEPLHIYLALISSLNDIMVPIQGPKGVEVGIGRLPTDIYFGIEASSLQEAFQKYPETIEKFRKEAMQRQAEATASVAKAEAARASKPDLLVAQESDLRKLKLVK